MYECRNKCIQILTIMTQGNTEFNVKPKRGDSIDLKCSLKM